jgi:hypothetical protein
MSESKKKTIRSKDVMKKMIEIKIKNPTKDFTVKEWASKLGVRTSRVEYCCSIFEMMEEFFKRGTPIKLRIPVRRNK